MQGRDVKPILVINVVEVFPVGIPRTLGIEVFIIGTCTAVVIDNVHGWQVPECVKEVDIGDLGPGLV